jgi:sortase A
MAADSHQSNNNPSDGQAPDANTAADLIRQKVSQLYDEEPAASDEIAEVTATTPRSTHQQFMYDLSTSGKDLATVQTEWHDYYQSLPSDQKHQVWQEFYASQSAITAPAKPQAISEHKQQAAGGRHAKTVVTKKTRKLREARSKDELQASIRQKVSGGGKLKAKHHLQSLLFGLGMGFLVLVIFLFSFFNEVIIAPFIQPSRAEASTPLIINESTVAASSTPEVIIPKINVQIPVVYGQTSIEEDVMQNALEEGVVHYPTTSVPGQNGNAAFFGHSSNNIFNKGKYKFAFVLLHTLVPGDTFYLTYNSKVYAYKVITKKVVEPSEVSVLDPVPGTTATATLITCDPPGTSLHRLVVVGEQISPDPTSNAAAATPNQIDAGAQQLPGNGPTLWSRVTSTITGKIAVTLIPAAFALVILRRMYS